MKARWYNRVPWQQWQLLISGEMQSYRYSTNVTIPRSTFENAMLLPGSLDKAPVYSNDGTVHWYLRHCWNRMFACGSLAITLDSNAHCDINTRAHPRSSLCNESALPISRGHFSPNNSELARKGEIWVSLMSSKSSRSFTFEFIALCEYHVILYSDISRVYSNVLQGLSVIRYGKLIII